MIKTLAIAAFMLLPGVAHAQSDYWARQNQRQADALIEQGRQRMEMQMMLDAQTQQMQEFYQQQRQRQQNPFATGGGAWAR